MNALQSGSTSSGFHDHGFTSTHCVIELEYVSDHVQGLAVMELRDLMWWDRGGRVRAERTGEGNVTDLVFI